MPLSGESILIVDDEDLNLKVLETQLGSNGYQVLTAMNGTEAMEKASEQPDLILLDVMMPGLDGFETCKRLKSDPATRDIPVIFISAVEDIDQKSRAFEIGGVDYITKPFQSRELLARVRTHLTIRRQEIQIREYDERLENMVMEHTNLPESDQLELRRDFNLQAVLNSLLRLSLEDLTMGEMPGKALDEILSISWLSFKPKGCIFLLDRDKGEFNLAASHTLRERGIAALSGKTGKLYAQGGFQPSLDENFQPLPLSPRSGGLAIPLVHKSTLLGTLTLFRKDSILEKHESRHLNSIANTLSAVIGHIRAEEELLQSALHDTLTGLANKAKLLDRLAQALRESGGEGYALFMLDLDSFKLINESLGHDTGDRLLVEIASRLTALMTKECLMARLGGDEFGALTSGVSNGEEAVNRVKRLMGWLAEPFNVDGHEIFITTSVGVVLCQGYEKPEDLIRDADTALHEAKAEGADSWRLFDAIMRLKATSQMQTANQLRRGLKQKELVLHLQPLVDLRSGVITGSEALVRWNHPKHGLIPPNEFIPVAEESKLILELGSWVLKEACRLHSRLLGEHCLNPSFMMSVNISGVQLGNPSLAGEISSILDETGMRPANLKLEITETAVMQKAELAMDILRTLKDLGIGVSIDDFGTGYSSLAYLHKFPIDMLKIDRAFISRVNDDSENLEIVRTIITMAHTLNLKVIGEGIEDKTQLTLLKALNCDYGQGFYYSKPLPFDEFVQLIGAQPSAWPKSDACPR